ncbi:MAG: exo-alpha-sialidase [Fuerstiella sp.]|nr:exo-alpha-sialidase [Fuerstiella sp.]MCP4504822.1 exo-alpha-sialidase [Fuerstiella sp.]
MISRILHIAFMVLSSGAMSSPAAELAVIAKGRMKAATAVNGKWEPGEKCIVSTGTHYLFADRGIGAGDFKVRARLSLDALNGSAAAFVLDNNKFGFEGSHRRMFVQGPKFADGLTIAEPEDFITPDQPFDLLVSRIGKSLTFHIDGKKVWETEFDVNEIKSVGLRPWRATMRIYEFSVEGNLIAASLPELTAVSRPVSWAASLAERRRIKATVGTDEFERELLSAAPEQMNLLVAAKKAGLMELAPVHLPTSPKGDNDHYGWPVATMIGNTIIVVHRSMPGHNPRVSGSSDADTTYSTILRSNDSGKTWSEPYDIRDCMTEHDRNRGGSVPLCHRFKFDPDNRSPLGYKLHLNAIGTTRDGAVIVVSDHGVFRSDDQGKTWRHLRLAFREDRHDGHFVYVGPRIINHPKHGLLLFAHHTVYRFRRPVDIVRELAVYRSRDGGESWERTTLKLPRWCKPAEPDAIFHDGRFVAIVRNQAPANTLAQMRFRFGDAEIADVANTPMKTKVSVDTSAICFNPVTSRYEVVQSKRDDMSIHLYSLAPEDWTAAEWRHEGRLFQREAGFYNVADGFHTGGAVIDHEKNVQHIFFYSGHPGGPAGVFRLTRTLDTPKLVHFLKP